MILLPWASAACSVANISDSVTLIDGDNPLKIAKWTGGVVLALLSVPAVAQTPANWTQASPETSPPVRAGHAMTYDSTHSQTVLFGGIAGTDVNDTWIWDGSNWTLESPQTSPSAQGSYAMDYDSSHGQIVWFGEEGPGGIQADTWLWTGAPLQVGPTISAVVNGASFVGGGVVAGEIATLFGSNLTSSTGINLTSGLPLPETFLTA